MSTATVSSPTLPMLVAQVEVVSVERISPTFLRFAFGGDALADFGVDGPTYDQRIKLILPDPGTGRLPAIVAEDPSWLGDWLAQAPEERVHMRTYTIRAVRGVGVETKIFVDIAVHGSGADSGPGSRWASTARVGEQIIMICPRRGMPFGGIEFAPPTLGDLLLVADETAVPAVCAVLEQLPEAARGIAFMEVPESGDMFDVRRPTGIEVTWLPRNGAPLGQRLQAAVIEHLGMATPSPETPVDDVDPDLWETPTYSSSGESISPSRVVGGDFDGVYAWIAGESKVVTGLRRHLVSELGMDRSQVAFMGYWRRGVAMKS